MLLAFLGVGDGQTDILAHVFGFASGVGVGWRIQKNQVELLCRYRPFNRRCVPLPSGLTRIRAGVSRSYQVRCPVPPDGNLPRPSVTRMK